MLKKKIYIYNFSPPHTLKTKSLFEANSQCKRSKQSRGLLWGDVTEARMWSKCQRRGELAEGHPSSFSLGKLLPDRQAGATEDNALAFPSFLRLQGYLAAKGQCDRPALTSSVWPLGEEFTLSAPLNPRALCPGSHKNARLCQVWGLYLPSRPPYLDGNGLRIFWVTLSPPGRKHLDGLLIPTEIWWT